MYEALQAAGVQMRENRHAPKAQEISPATAERVVAFYLAGASAKRNAADLGLPVKDVTRLLEERGVKRTRSEVAASANAERRRSEATPRDEWPSEVRAEVLERYVAGESGEVIAECLGLAHAGVYQMLRKEGVLRPRGAVKRIGERGRPHVEEAPGVDEVPPAVLAEQAVARYEAGESPRLIGLALRVPSSRVYRVLKQWGVLRSKSEARQVAHARRRAAADQSGQAGAEATAGDRRRGGR